MFTGPNINKTGLVLHLDAANIKSFKGEPTTNLATNTLLVDGWPGSYALIDSESKTFNLNTNVSNWGGGDSWNMFYYDVTPYIGSYITISAIFEVIDQTTGNFSWLMIGQPISGQTYLGYSATSDRSYKDTPTKEKISWSGIANNSGKIGITIWMTNGANGSITVRLTNLQVEVKSYPTPFVNGTRGTTVATGGGLKNIASNGNNGELLNGPVYSSENNGSITFDGINDRIQTSYSPTFGDFSVCLIFKDNGSGAWGRIVDKLYSTGFFISSYFASSGVNYVGAGIIEPNWPHGIALPYEPNKYHFFASVRSGTIHTIYLDGITQTTSKTVSSSLLDSTSIAFGDWSESLNQPFNGNLPYVQIYNKALTAQEILQNYNATKSRFGL